MSEFSWKEEKEADEFQKKLHKFLMTGEDKVFAKYISDNILAEGEELKEGDIDIRILKYKVEDAIYKSRYDAKGKLKVNAEELKVDNNIAVNSEEIDRYNFSSYSIIHYAEEDMPKLNDIKDYFLNLYKEKHPPEIAKYEMKMTKKENRLKITIDNIKGSKDAAKAIEMGKHAAHRAYKIFVKKVNDLGPKGDENKKKELLKDLNSTYIQIVDNLENVVENDDFEVSKFELKKIRKLADKIHDTADKIGPYAGEMKLDSDTVVKVVNSNIDIKKLKANDLQAVKKSPLQKIKKFIQNAAKKRQKNKNAKAKSL